MNDFQLKFVILGDKDVGKTTLIKNYIKGVVPTIGVDFFSTTIFMNQKNFKIHVWDTSGNRNFLNIIKVYFQSSIGVILVFNLNDLESFNNIDFWMQQILIENKGYQKIVLIGTHSDKRKLVTPEMIEQKCKFYKLDYFETGEDFHIEHCFLKMISEIMKEYKLKSHLFHHLEGFKNLKPIETTTDYIRFDDVPDKSCCQNCSIL